jgi:sphingosine kinase
VQEVLYTTNRLLEYKNLLIIGSDKTLHEAINGMLTRPDWLSIAALCKITVIPCGSGNVLSKNLGVTHPYLAALTSIRGTPQPMDVMSVSNPSGYRLFSYLSLNWGLISDIQAEKKDFDWTATRFGILRALPMILSPKIYQGTLHYLPAKSASANSVPDSVQTHTSLSEAERLAHPGPMDQYNKVDVKFLPEEWKTLSAAFSVFMAQNLQWTNKKLLTAPLASSTDGAMDLVFTQSGVLGLLAWLLFPNKAFHIRLPNWSFERARAFILEPNNDLSGHAGHLVVDNQEIPYSTIRCEVHKGLLQVITPVRKVESQEAKAKILQEKWDQLAAQKRWDLVSFESYQQWLSMYWIGAFAFLVLVLAVALQL